MRYPSVRPSILGEIAILVFLMTYLPLRGEHKDHKIKTPPLPLLRKGGMGEVLR